MKKIFKKILYIFMILVLCTITGSLTYARNGDETDDFVVVCASVDYNYTLNFNERLLARYDGQIVQLGAAIQCGDINIPAYVRYVHKIPFINPANGIAYHIILVYCRSSVSELRKTDAPLSKNCKIQIRMDEGIPFEFEDNLDIRHDRLEDVLRMGIILYNRHVSLPPDPLSKDLLLDSRFLKNVRRDADRATATATIATTTTTP